MKIFHLANIQDLDQLLGNPLNHFFKKERIFIDISTTISEQDTAKFLTSVNELYSNISLIINWEDFEKKISKLNLLQITYFIKLEEKKLDTNYNDITTRDVLPEFKSPLVFNTNQKIEAFLSFKFGYELIVNFENIYNLSTSISLGFYCPNLLEIILTPTLDLQPEAIEIFTNKFNFLKTYLTLDKPVYFSPFLVNFESWEASTRNPFRGPRYVDIDFSNYCTHNCVFCGLYNEKSKEKIAAANIKKETLEQLYKGQISKDAFNKIVSELPANIKCIHLGGAGEPTSHPHFFEFVRELRERNINLYIFSHFAYMTDQRLLDLHQLGSDNPQGLHFFLNISAGSGKVYSQVRPNQKPEIFDKIIKQLMNLTDRRMREERGVFFTYMSVINKFNYHEIPLMVAQSYRTGAYELWLKPIEIHGNETLQYIIGENDLLPYLINLKLGLYFSTLLKVSIRNINNIESLLRKFDHALDKAFLEKSFSLYIKESILKFEELRDILLLNHDYKANKIPYKKSEHLFETDNKSHDIVQNAGIPLKLYDKIPCSIGYEYIRFGVNGEAWPCCISNYPISTDKNEGLNKVWHSQKLKYFRELTNNFPSHKTHRKDPEWKFCQQCTHTEINNDNYIMSHKAKK